MDTPVSDAAPLPKKRVRKPRGRGLRTKTGCLTCRKRHKKCDEKLPVCGPCMIAQRDCVFPSAAPGAGAHAVVAPKPGVGPPTSDGALLVGAHRDEALPSTETAGDDVPVSPMTTRHPAQQPPGSAHSTVGFQPVGRTTTSFSGPPGPQTHTGPPGISLGDVYGGSNAFSPDTVCSELWTADLASTRWLSLLAADAANADSSFSLAPSPAPHSGPDGGEQDPVTEGVRPAPEPTFYTQPGDPERKAWQLDRDFTLSNHEAVLFRHFADKLAGWLDLLEPLTPFSSRAMRLALRNTGVMKSILALSAKHLCTTEKSRRGSSNGMSGGIEKNGDSTDGAVQYYYETLHYVQEALAYTSYTHSEELLVTVIAISSYEMLDEADGRGNWQRHLKGVFWIQRSQNTDGECGGLRQAVWWSWLRQDIWAAFRERRRCLTIWKPRLQLADLDQNQLARRTVFLLAQAVNCCASGAPEDAAAAAARSQRDIERLVRDLEQTRAHWGEHFKPLPTTRSAADEVFAPLWIHPPQFGVAVQAFSFAQILITLHAPMPQGFDGYLKVQRVLSDAVETICGVAMEMTDAGCQIFSAQCLYGAGLCVQEPKRREKIIQLMEECEARMGWAPMATWRNDLRREWAKADSDGGGGRRLEGGILPPLR